MNKCLALSLALCLAWASPAWGGLAHDRIFRPSDEIPKSEIWVTDPPEQISIQTSNGLRVNGLFWKGRLATLVVVFQGNAGNQYFTALATHRLRLEGYSVLIAGYRGYGNNPGRPSEIALKEDSKAWIALARSIGFADSQIILAGISLGSALALEGSLHSKPKGVVLFSAFTSISALAPGPLRMFIKDKFDNRRVARCVTSPVYLVHGERDKLVPVEMHNTLLQDLQPLSLGSIVADGHAVSDVTFLKETVKAVTYFDSVVADPRKRKQCGKEAF